jgi:hypothetical protein
MRSKTNKRKQKANKPKLHSKKYLSAQEVKKFISNKYRTNDPEFWKDLFSECPWGETTLLPFNKEEDNNLWMRYSKYVYLLEKEFHQYMDDEYCVEIENDL